MFVLDAEGSEIMPVAALGEADGRSTAVVIGGFPSGSLNANLSSLKPVMLSLGKEMLKVWTVTSEMLSAAFALITKP